MENPVDFVDLVADVENDETDRVVQITGLVDERTESPYSDSNTNTEVSIKYFLLPSEMFSTTIYTFTENNQVSN